MPRAVALSVAALVALAALSACKGRFKLPADARFVSDVALADGFGCARMKDGSVRTWGANESGELGDGTTEPRSESVRALAPGDWVKIAVGGKHGCAANTRGEVSCWGTSGAGELRAGTVQAKDLALGSRHSCALTSAGDVSCWGASDAGQLGGVDSGAPIVRGATALAAGGDATCAILRDRALWCWGRLPLRGVLPPTRIEGLDDVVAVAVGDTHVCVVLAWGGVACWGRDEEGELGDGAFTDRGEPVDVQGLAVPARQVAVGRAHSCALLRNDTVHCWGANARAQLADGTTTHRPSAGLVNGLFEIEGITAAGDASCARFTDGSGRCWGGLSIPKTAGTTIPVPAEVRW